MATIPAQLEKDRSGLFLVIGLVLLGLVTLVFGWFVLRGPGSRRVQSVGNILYEVDRLRFGEEEVTFELDSEITDLGIQSKEFDKDVMATYLGRLGIYPINKQRFVGNQQIVENLKRVRIQLLPIDRLNEDLQTDTGLAGRTGLAIFRSSDGQKEAVNYVAGTFRSGDTLEIPIYIDEQELATLSPEIRQTYVSEVVLFAVYLNFQEDLKGRDPYAEFINRVGVISKNLTWTERLLKLLVKKAYAQVCTGTVDCGRAVYGQGNCSLTNQPCWVSSTCPIYPSEYCQLPPPTCVYDGGNTFNCSVTTYPACVAGCPGGNPCSQQGSCFASCTPQCSGKVCGEANGCGGSCPTTGYNNWSGWSCGADFNPGGCGTVEIQHTCTRTNQCGGSETQTFGTGSFVCNECGPTGSQSCGNWTISYNCAPPQTGCLECGPRVTYTPGGNNPPACGSYNKSTDYDCQGDLSQNLCNECGPAYTYDPPGPPACGVYNRQSNYNCQANSGQQFCTECGPYISAWSAWSACTAPTYTRTRTRTCSEDCGENDCASVALSETENCTGRITGTFFDASEVNDCTAYASLPKVAGAGITIVGEQGTTNNTTTNANGVYNQTGLQVPSNYNLSYTVDAAQWVADPPKLLCDGGLSNISLTTQGQVVTRRVGLYRIYGGWFQGRDGDVAAKEGITVDIPATCQEEANRPSCASFLSGGSWYTPLVRSSGNSDAGVVYTPEYDLGSAPNALISKSQIYSSSVYDGREYGYEYFNINSARSSVSNQDWDGTSEITGNATGTVYHSAGDITIGTDWNVGATEKIFILHDGNVTISSDFNIAQGGFFGIVASGNITFTAAVANAEGIYIADNVYVQSTGNTASEVQFRGEGTFIGWQGVSLVRDRGTLNNSGPAELFIFRPDLIVNAFDGVRAPEVRWQEVAP